LTPILAFPFYFCAGVDVPIIEEMLRLGFSGASVLSFMLAAPGTNLTSLIMYGKLFGIKAASYLIGISLISAITIGFILGQ